MSDNPERFHNDVLREIGIPNAVSFVSLMENLDPIQAGHLRRLLFYKIRDNEELKKAVELTSSLSILHDQLVVPGLSIYFSSQGKDIPVAIHHVSYGRFRWSNIEQVIKAMYPDVARPIIDLLAHLPSEVE